MSRRSERGLLQVPVAGATLLALLVLISVSSLILGQAAETWDSQVRHELEQDSVFRGGEFKRAIEEYQKVNGRPPVKLEDLCPKETANTRYIRRCWKDPITGKDFRLIGANEVGQRRALREAKELAEGEAARDGARERTGSEGAADTPVPLTGYPARDARAERRRREGPTLSSAPLSLPGQLSSQQLEDGEKPFIGVASSSDRKGFVELQGTRIYSEWEFVVTPPARAPATAPPQVPPPRGNPAGSPSPSVPARKRG